VEVVRSRDGADGGLSASEAAAKVRRHRLVRRARALLVLLLVAASGVFALRVRKWRQRKAAVLALNDSLRGYSECMLGAPLAQGETATARLRRIEAGLPEPLALDVPIPPAESWPIRCRDDLDHAHDAIVDSEALAREAPMRHLDGLILSARIDPAPQNAPDLVDDLLRAELLAGVSALPRRYPPPSRHLAPPAASPLTADALPTLPVPARSAPDELRGGPPLTVRLSFLDAAAMRWTCAFSPLHGEPLREAECGEVTAGAVSATREDAPRGPGFLRTVRGRFDRFELVRWVPGADPDVLALPTSIETVGLYGDQLVWVTAHKWYARTVPPERAPLGDPVELGEVTGTSPELEACDTSSALVLGVKTFDATLAERKSWRVMAAREANAWQTTPGRALVDVAATFTCEGHSGTWTRFDHRVVTQVSCNADRCETHASAPLSIPWDVGGPLFTADLGGRALVLGLGTTPAPLTGKSVTSVRMRMAPLAAIGEASDVVLFSDAAHDGAPISDVAVYVRDSVALVLLKGDGPFHYRAIRVDDLGNFEPVTLAN
jgi:hypothetical protein